MRVGDLPKVAGLRARKQDGGWFSLPPEPALPSRLPCLRPSVGQTVQLGLGASVS